MKYNINITVSWLNIAVVLFLTLVFLGLKLSGKITWSWWWVFSPLWIDALLIVGMFIFMVILIPIFKYITWRD